MVYGLFSMLLNLDLKDFIEDICICVYQRNGSIVLAFVVVISLPRFGIRVIVAL
jgi:hypothetical protein